MTIATKFSFSIDNDNKQRVMHSKSDNIETMTSDKADEITEKIFHSLKNYSQNNVESMNDSEFIFDYVRICWIIQCIINI